jgi:hypothetical protein
MEVGVGAGVEITAVICVEMGLNLKAACNLPDPLQSPLAGSGPPNKVNGLISARMGLK